MLTNCVGNAIRLINLERLIDLVAGPAQFVSNNQVILITVGLANAICLMSAISSKLSTHPGDHQHQQIHFMYLCCLQLL